MTRARVSVIILNCNALLGSVCGYCKVDLEWAAKVMHRSGLI